MDDIESLLERVRGSNLPIADKYAMVAMRWVDEDNAARLLEETKSTVLEERKNALIEKTPMADNAAERQAKADPGWKKWIENMVTQRTKANKLKIAMKVLDMRHSEQQSLEATRRAELKQLGA